MNQPRLRFKEFKGEWEKERLTHLTKILNGLTYKPDDIRDSGTFVIRSSNVQNNQIVDNKNVYVDNKVVNSANVLPSDIVVVVRNGSRNLIGKHAIVKIKMDNTVIGAFMSLLRGSNNYFVNDLLDSESFTREIHRSLGATINQITKKDFKLMYFDVPSSKQEQQKIGHFFQNLDRQIELQSDKLEHLKQSKRGYLQKMFANENNIKPRLMFSVFNGVWNSNSLGNISTIKTGKLDANRMVNGGKYDFYTSGIKVYRINDYAFDEKAITIAGNGANVGYMHLANGKFNAYQRTYVLYNFVNIERTYLFYVLNTKMSRIIYNNSRNGNIPYIVLDVLSKLNIKYPSLSEQRRIGQFFSHLDCLIDLQQQKVDHLKRQKQAYLQKMFI